MMKITEEVFGQLEDGREISLFTLTNARGMQVKITPYGGRITAILVPDKHGVLGDVVLGYDTLAGYLADESNFGAIIGRVTNRIAKGRFSLQGRDYTLALNNGPNHLHGGRQGFSKVLWEAQALAGEALQLSYLSPDGEEGYPGNLRSTVRYALTDDNKLSIHISARTDQATPVNLTSHSYFNLSAGAHTIQDHQLQLNADAFIAVDETVIPTGEMPPVKDTGMDFRQARSIGSGLAQTQGYDNTYVLNGADAGLRLAARAADPVSGRQVEVFTSLPGIHFYTANHLDGSLHGKQGQPYQRHQGFTLETNYFPDAPNQPRFPSIILQPGETFQQTTVYQFSCQ